MESNISRDHIALEAMKAILNKSISKRQTVWNKIVEFLGGRSKDICDLPNNESVARNAYLYADAMIKERKKEGRNETK